MKKKLSVSASELDWELLHKARGNLSLSAFLLRCALQHISHNLYLTYSAPDCHERNKTQVLRFLKLGCVSVEDIESVAFSLSQTEIENYLFELEQEGVIARQIAKRGRMWRWEVLEKKTLA